MNKIQREGLKEAILSLAALKGTGTPVSMARRYGISTRTIKRMVRELRREGHNIWYSIHRRTYVLD